MKPTTKTTVLASTASAVAIAGLVTLAIISPRAPEPTPPEQSLVATSSMYSPNVKIGWGFSTIRRHRMTDGSRADIPFADVRAGDVAKLVMLCGTPARQCATGTVRMPAGPLDDFRVVVIMHEVLLVLPVSAYMERTSWNRTAAGPVPAWEQRINSDTISLPYETDEQSGVRVYDARLDEWQPVKRRAVRP